MSSRETYRVTIEGVQRDLEKFEVAPGVTIAILNILGDVELVQAASKGLTRELTPKQGEVLITAEAKSIPLIYQLAVDMNLPYIVLRKKYKSYMGDAIQAQTESITTGDIQTLWLDEKDRALIQNKRVIVVDDVVSTGSTLEGMQTIIDQTAAQVVAQAAIFTEGDESKWEHIIALGHLPVWVDQ
jgi:adenine phosphoribosyltransferase